MMIEMGIDPARAPRNPDHDFLIYQSALLYGFIALLSTVLLRYTRDLGVWRILQGAILVVDISIVLALFATLEHQGRLWDTGLWRQTDWTNLVGTFVVIVIRVLFLASVGVTPETTTAAKKRP